LVRPTAAISQAVSLSLNWVSAAVSAPGSAAASPNSLQSSPRLQGFFRLVPIPPNYAQIYFYFQISTTDSFSFSFKTRSFTLVVLVHHNLYIATSQYLIS